MAKYEASKRDKCPHCLQGVLFEPPNTLGTNKIDSTEIITTVSKQYHLYSCFCPICKNLILTLYKRKDNTVNPINEEILLYPRTVARNPVSLTYHTMVV